MRGLGDDFPGGPEGPLLTTSEAIMDYLGFGETLFKKWVARGMPVFRDKDGRYYAHKDNLEEFFRRFTRRRSSEP